MATVIDPRKRPTGGRFALSTVVRRDARGQADAGSATDRPEARDLSSPIRDAMPPFIGVPFWFSKIPITLPLALSGNQCAMYGLLRIRPDAIGQELTLAGYDLAMRAADVAGTFGGAGDAVAWGSTDGFNARLIIGRNLPFRDVRTWEAQDFIGANITGATLQTAAFTNGDNGADVIARQVFPTGQLTDTTLNPKEIIQHYAEQYRIVYGQTLDVALVIRASTAFTGGSGSKFVYGLVEGVLRVGLTVADNQWTRRG